MNIHHMGGWYAVIGCKNNNANEGCNSCASLLAGLLLQLLVVSCNNFYLVLLQVLLHVLFYLYIGALKVTYPVFSEVECA